MTRERRRRIRRKGSLVAAAAAAGTGFLPPTTQILVWLGFSLVAVLTTLVNLLDAHWDVVAVRNTPMDGMTAHDGTLVAADLISAENRREAEGNRFLVAMALLAIGITAIIRLNRLVAPLLFFVIALVVLNSVLSRIEGKELRDQLAVETEGR